MSLTKVYLRDVLDIKRGASLSGDYYSEFGKYIRLTLGNFNYPNGGFKENTAKKDIYFIGDVKPEFILKKGDIITPLTEQVSGLLGETAKIPEDDKYIQSGDVGLVVPNELKLNREFAYYLISSPIIKKQLDASSQQTKIRHTSPEYIRNCIAWIPSEIDAQKNIAYILDSINKKIEINNQIISNLESLAKTIYDYWFLQFDFPDENNKPYKSSGGKMIWNAELKREIPDGWSVTKLPQVADIQYGVPLSTEQFSDVGYPVIRIRDIIENTTSAFTSENVSTNYLTKENDLLVGMDGNFQMNYWFRNNEIVNQRIVRIRETTLPIMIIRYQIEPYILAKVDSIARSTVGHLGDDDIKNLNIMNPSHKLDYTLFNVLICKIMELKKEMEQLRLLRDFLLPLFMNGQAKITE